MKRIHWSLLLAAMALLIMLVPVLAQEEGDDTLTIMHTNDVHARVLQINRFAGTCDEEAAEAGECFGGVARRMTMINQIRDEGGNSILVDGGDEFQGTLFYNKYKGEEAKQFMNALGYDAMAVGNHELDDGPSGLANFASGVDFPVLSANMDVSADADLNGLIAPYAVLDVNGEQIGVIGYTTEDTEILSSPGPDVHFTNIDEAVTAAIAELEGMGINKIVALSHAGYGRDQDLAAVIDGIDVIVAGHTHSFLSNEDEDADGPYPTVVNSPNGDPVLIVSSQSYGKYLGRLDVTFDENGVPASWEGDPILLDASVEENAEILAQAMELNEPLEELRTELIGVADVLLDGDRSNCRFGECTMGDLIADAMVWGTAAQGTEIVIQNGGGIRSSIEAGDVSVGDVLEVLPFGNLISTFGLTGADVVAALENGVSRAENPENEGTGRFAQVSGLRYSWDGSQPEGERIVSVEVMGEDGSYTDIDLEAVYQVASNDFMRGGGDGYSMFEENGIDAYDFGPTLDEVVVKYITEMSPVAPELEGRITRVDEVMAAEEGDDEEAAAEEGDGEEAAAEEGDGEEAAAEEGDGEEVAAEEGDGEEAAAEEGDGEEAAAEEDDGEEAAAEEGDGEEAAAEEGDGGEATAEEGDGEEAAAEEGDGEEAAAEEGDGEEAAADGEEMAAEEMEPETLPVTGSAPSTWPTLALVLLVITTLFGSDMVRRKRSA